MAKVARIAEPVPFSAINVTPFIDVMLVLLIVMILSIPIATHKVPVDLPGPGSAPSVQTPQLLSIDRAGTLRWDGRAIADTELPARLAALRADPGAVLHMQTDPDARYDRFDSILAEVKRAGVAKLGFVGNERLID